MLTTVVMAMTMIMEKMMTAEKREKKKNYAVIKTHVMASSQFSRQTYLINAN